MEKEQREHHAFRLIFMILFWLFLRVSFALTGLASIIQWVALWFQEEPLEPLLQWNCALRRYQQQILAYLSFESEDKVFPFADWPSGE